MSSKTVKTKNAVEQGRPAILSLMQKGTIEAADVVKLRRDLFCDRSLSRIEVEDLFALDAVVRPALDAWMDFFVEAVTDHLVWDLRPTGILDDTHARWLVDKVDASRTASSFAILVNILDEAHRVPRWFETAVKKRALADWPGLVDLSDRSAPSLPA